MECCNGQDNSLATLCERLRSEKLLVASELENLQRLNEQIEYERNTVAQLAWVGRQEQVIYISTLSKKTFVKDYLAKDLD